MTMTPDRFRQLLDHETADAPPAPLVSTDLTAGRARLGRRRATVGVAVAAAVVVAAGAISIGTRTAPDPDPEPIKPPSRVVPPSPSESEVDAALDSCAAALIPPDVLGSQGRLMSVASTAVEVQAVFGTQGERYWAECTVPLEGDDQEPGVLVHDAQNKEGSGFTYATSTGCPDSEPASCRLWTLSVVDRVNPEVARIRFDLWDGSSATVETLGGYYAFTTLVPLPDGVAFKVDDNGLVSLVGADTDRVRLERVTYFDAEGNPLAATAMDGSGSGLTGEVVDGLPLTNDAYPSLNGNAR
jgi:hypothetical protein